MAIAKTLRGPDIKVFINGRIYAPVTSFRFNTATGRRPIMGIDQGTPFELAPGPQHVTGTIEVLRIRNSGGLEGAGIAAPESLILQEKYFTLTVIDRVTDSVILQIDEAALVDQNWSAVAKGVVAGSFSFEGMSWGNEVQIR